MRRSAFSLSARQKVTRAVAVLAILAAILAGGIAYAGGTTTITASGATLAIGDIGGVEVIAAQSFQVPSGILSQITFKLDANVGSPTGDLHWSVRTDNSGEPSATVLVSGDHSPSPSQTNTITVLAGPALADDTKYWFLLGADSQPNDTRYVWQRSAASVYADGELKYFTGSWNSEDGDLESSYTTVDPTPTPTGTATSVPTATPTPNSQFVLATSESGHALVTEYRITTGEGVTHFLLMLLVMSNFFLVFLGMVAVRRAR